MNSIHSKGDILMRKPVRLDAAQVHDLIRRSPPLDLNSAYNYALLCEHFADTCVVCLTQGRVIGFLSAYIPPQQPDTLFIWQVAVDADQRGKQLAQMMLSSLLERPECAGASHLETTITPSNIPSTRLFERLAESRGAAVVKEEFIPGDQLGDGHESEILFRIGPISRIDSQGEHTNAHIRTA